MQHSNFYTKITSVVNFDRINWYEKNIRKYSENMPKVQWAQPA